MGYYTRYTLTVWPNVMHHRVSAAIVKAAAGHSPFDFDCEVTWYDHERDIHKVSRAIPEVIITVRGEGQDSGDEWILHAQGGHSIKHRRTKWTPPPPDENMRRAMREAQARVDGDP